MTPKQIPPPIALPDHDVRTFWFGLRRARPWRTLALVSADGARVGVLAHQLAQIASLAPNRSVLIIDAVPRVSGAIVRPPVGHYGVKAMREGMTEGEALGKFVAETTATIMDPALDLVLVAVPSPIQHAHAIPLIGAVDAAVLCVELDTSRLAVARETLQSLEPDRLLGTVLIGGD